MVNNVRLRSFRLCYHLVDDIGCIPSGKCDSWITALTRSLLLLGFPPNPEAPAKAMGTANARAGLFFAAIPSPANDFVGAAMFYSRSYANRNPDRRTAKCLYLHSSVGYKGQPHSILGC